MKITIQNNNMHSGKYGFLTRVIVMTLATILAAYLLPGVHVESIWAAIITAIVISLLNNFIRPILIVLTLPFTIMSMGLFLLIINAVIIMLASGLVNKFHVDTFWSALLFSLLLTIFNYLLELPNKIMSKQQFKENGQNQSQMHRDVDEEYTDYEDVND